MAHTQEPSGLVGWRHVGHDPAPVQLAVADDAVIWHETVSHGKVLSGLVAGVAVLLLVPRARDERDQAALRGRLGDRLLAPSDGKILSAFEPEDERLAVVLQIGAASWPPRRRIGTERLRVVAFEVGQHRLAPVGDGNACVVVDGSHRRRNGNADILGRVSRNADISFRCNGQPLYEQRQVWPDGHLQLESSSQCLLSDVRFVRRSCGRLGVAAPYEHRRVTWATGHATHRRLALEIKRAVAHRPQSRADASVSASRVPVYPERRRLVPQAPHCGRRGIV